MKRGDNVAMHVTKSDVDKLHRKLGYRGCSNCKFGESTFTMCVQGKETDNRLHFICPKWVRKEVNNET